MIDTKVIFIDSRIIETKVPLVGKETTKINKYRIEDINPPYFNEEITVSSKGTAKEIMEKTIIALKKIEDKTNRFNEKYERKEK